MTRTTLKLLKPVDRNAPPETQTSRARRSPHGARRSAEAPAPLAHTNLPPPPAAHEEDAKHPRLSKRMSELGLCSRREADEWIENGWVKVDGQVVNTLGVRVSPDARIEIDPAAERHQSELVTILLNKPVGYVSGQPEDGHEPAIVLIRPENRWPERWRYAYANGPTSAWNRNY